MTTILIGLIILLLVQLLTFSFLIHYLVTQLTNNIKALMSRNLPEYLAAIKPAVKEQNTPVPEDMVDISQLSQDEFDKTLKKM